MNDTFVLVIKDREIPIVITDAEWLLGFDCPVCSDRGVIGVEVPVTHELFGKTFECPNPNCRVRNENRANRRIKSLKGADIPAKYRRLSFETWDKELSAEEKTGKWKAYLACRMFAAAPDHYVSMEQVYRRFKQNWEYAHDHVRNSLILSGSVGLGKTGLVACVYNDLKRCNEPVLYIRTQDLIASVQSRYSRFDDRRPLDQMSSDDLIDYVKTTHILILDEFGLENATDDRREIVEKIIRYRAGQELPVIVTTNSNRQQMREEWGDKTVDVLLEMGHWITVDGVKLRDTAEQIANETF